jgi:diguanylate cyclase (GGDEF)-like protein
MQIEADVTSREDEIHTLRLEVARLRAQLSAMEVLADTDGLTGLLNRRAFVRELDRAITGHERYGFSTALAYADVRGLKVINDTLGHDAGDDALRHVAGGLVGGVRATDFVGRLGGDEFGIILTHLDEADARERVATLRQKVSSSTLSLEGTGLSVRLRMGLTMIRDQDTTRSALKRADTAMYASERLARAQRSER